MGQLTYFKLNYVLMRSAHPGLDGFSGKSGTGAGE